MYKVNYKARVDTNFTWLIFLTLPKLPLPSSLTNWKSDRLKRLTGGGCECDDVEEREEVLLAPDEGTDPLAMPGRWLYMRGGMGRALGCGVVDVTGL